MPDTGNNRLSLSFSSTRNSDHFNPDMTTMIMTLNIVLKIKLWTVSKCSAVLQCVHFACGNCTCCMWLLNLNISKLWSDVNGWVWEAGPLLHQSILSPFILNCRLQELTTAEACSMLQLPAAAQHGDKVPLNIIPWPVLPSPSFTEAKKGSSKDKKRFLFGLCQETSLHSFLADHQLPNIWQCH